jgi:hypothetical protein
MKDKRVKQYFFRGCDNERERRQRKGCIKMKMVDVFYIHI